MNPASAADWPVITRQGDQLLEGDRPFRFVGLCAPNLHQNESQVRADYSNRFPDAFEIRDSLEAMRRLGARATRTFSLSVASPADGALPAYLIGRRRYNEEAFRCLDRVMDEARRADVRIILPFIASQTFAGWRGVEEFGAFAGKPAGAFWTDAEVKADFVHLMEWLVNRRNTVNGVRYGDDPALLGWQFGNEFLSYAPDRRLDAAEWTPKITDWTLEMAAQLRRIDPRHLIIEAGGDREAFLKSPDIDVISVHLYEYWNRMAGLSTDLAALVRRDREECRGRKPLVIDECGLCTFPNLSALMEEVKGNGTVGALVWSLRGHRRDGSFYCHNEGGTPINSFHFPGFATGHSYDETRILDLIRREAFAIRGAAPVAIEAPDPRPVLFATDTGLTWRGSCGATHYSVERAPTERGPWEVAATGLHDSVIADVKSFEASGDARPITLWSDVQARAGDTWWYRVSGHNLAGATPPSDPISIVQT
jgi:mannan endo-1,4-beta-mannosidase